MYKIEDLIDKANEIHNGKYEYDISTYTKVTEKMKIICPEHGEFWQNLHQHINKGQGCPKCGKHVVKKEFTKGRVDCKNIFEECEKKFNKKFIYSQRDIQNVGDKVKIICPEHGEFEQVIYSHFMSKYGCPECAKSRISQNNQSNTEEFIKKAMAIHGNKYDYSKTVYNGVTEKVCIICPEHGEFLQKPYNHLSGNGCPVCGRRKTVEGNKLDTEEFKERANKIHKNFYDYSSTEYTSYRKKILINCPIHGEFSQTPDDHLQGKGCPKCGNQVSKAENEIYEYCCSLVGKENVVQRCRDVIKPKELDIYIPSIKVGIEYNGLRWHSDKYKTDKRYHYDKLIACKEKGIKLIQVFEDEYINRKDIVLSKIAHLLGKCENLPRIMGRKCEIREIGIKESRDFLEKNHIQGYGSGGVHLGAYFDNMLVGVMVFRKEKEGFWELTRFASDNKYICNGVGGKLFRYFIKNYDFKEIKSFADRRWTIDEENNIYIQLGFKFDSYTSVEYRYFKEEDGMERQHKFAFRKERLHKKHGLPTTMTESEMVKKLGYSKVYDCGLIKYVFKK